ncbi:hypothetical protein FY557_16720 [Chryseobacterium sp. SN22]|uniref:hypothetical protein n=1 Tax=Chryseobacterium sp. SN22 TaxID=2606431 RepID=UPI0011ED61F8|nr:hypothetical protein [Chryseobacterium sp. SN22]KAA0126547.1 hypothetical protein FY557_16720 [Chryseobacterium sp. SN22]
MLKPEEITCLVRGLVVVFLISASRGWVTSAGFGGGASVLVSLVSRLSAALISSFSLGNGGSIKNFFF